VNPLLIILSGDRAGERVSLEPQEKYVIGRDKEAQFCLPERKISRQHAILVWNPETSEVTLEDLNSLNGTFINGEAVTGINVLHHLDRIQIGSFLLQLEFPQEKKEMDSFSHASESIKDIPASDFFEPSHVPPVEDGEDTGGRFLQGKLDEIPFADLLQMLSNMKKSGYLWISAEKLSRPPRLSDVSAQLALIVLDAGEVVYAVSREFENEEAVYDVLCKEGGYFALFHSGRDKFSSRMSLPVEALLLEGFRRLDEERARKQEFQPKDKFEVNPQESLLALQPDELTLFQLAWKFKQMSRIQENSPFDEVKTKEILKKLVRSGFLLKA